METEHSCKYIKYYSQIATIQVEHKVTYLAYKHNDGVVLQIVHTEITSQISVQCLCKDLSFDKAKNMMLYFYENSVSVQNFLDILQDYNIKFYPISECVTA